MDSYELEGILTAINDKVKNDIDIQRLQTTYFVNCFVSKPIKPTELWPLPWDKEQETPKNNELPTIDMEKIKKMEQYLNNINNA